jgi:hypothetical protein
MYDLWPVGIFMVCLGAIGIGGVVMGYYGGKRGAVRYLWLGFFNGVWFAGFYVVGMIIMVELLVYFIGAVISYIGWYQEGYLRHYITPQREKREAKTYPSPMKDILPKFREWRRAQPFVCEKCGEFTHEIRDLCENCGTKSSLRKTTKADYKQRNLTRN